jgi:CxxC-x17-CxxC domain-containing protein
MKKFDKKPFGKSSGRSRDRSDSFGRDSFRKPSFGRSESRGPRFEDRGERRDGPRSTETFSATCDNCGKQCDLPFKPRGDKPVYCRDCFRKVAPGPTRSFDDRGPKSNQSDELKEINRKLDKIIRALEIE